MSPLLHVVIWDQPGEPQLTNCTTVFWNEFLPPGHSQDEISLPQYVEDNSDDLRMRFLTFVREVGESEIANNNAIEHLRILPEFSYWWMMLFACKRWSPTSNIIEAVRLLALEDILREIKPAKVSIASDRRTATNIIRKLCEQSGVEFQILTANNLEVSRRIRLQRLIPRPLGAIFVLAREITRRLGAPEKTAPNNNSVDVVFIDHLTRFDTDSALRGNFRSGFWSALTNCLDDAKQTSIFFHQFVDHPVTPNRKSTDRYLTGLNSLSTTQQHFLLDARLSAKVILKTLTIYLRLLRARFLIRKFKRSFVPSNSKLDLWKLFEKEWLDSLSGSTAILHSLIIAEFDRTISKIPPCRTVLYLMENQPWEMAFIQLWRYRRTEPLISVPHSTIRYWDLRYFSNPNGYRAGMLLSPPLPDVVAVNGPAELKSLDATGNPAEKIVEVEALQYLYLEDVQSAVSVPAIPNATMRLLVLGDFFAPQNTALLAMLQSSLGLTHRQISVTIKPHPLRPINCQDFPNLQFGIDTRPLVEQLTECDLVLATNGTSASAEAYQCGVPVMTILNGATFNFSPLRDISGAIFIQSPKHLAKMLDQVAPRGRIPHSDYFHIDKSLNRWKQLLSI